MSQNLADLMVKLSLDIKGFSKGLEVAAVQTKAAGAKLADSLGAATGKVNSMIGALTSLQSVAIVGAVAGIAAMTDRAIRSADAIGSMAEKIGVSTDFLQEFRYAAVNVGASVDIADSALERFVKQVGEAASGSASVKAIFADLGVSVFDANGEIRNAQGLMYDVADALQNIESPAERVRIAFKLFGAEGTELIAALSGGSEKLREFQAEAEKTGHVMDKETIAKASELRKQLDLLKSAAGNDLNKAFIALGPTLIRTAELAAKAAHAFAWMVEESQKGAKVGGVPGGGLPLSAQMPATALWGYNLYKDYQAAAASKAQSQEPAPLPPPPAKHRTALSYSNLADIDISAPGTQNASFGSKQLSTQTVSTIKDLDAVQRKADEAERKRKSVLSGIRRDLLQATGESIKLIEFERDARIEALKEIQLSVEEQAAAEKDIRAIAAEEIRAIEERTAEATVEHLEEQNRLWDEIGQTASNAFATMLMDGEFTFKQLGESLARDLLSKMVQSGVSAGTDWLGKALGGVLGAATGGWGGALMGIFGGSASGGSLVPGRAQIVGERGPELVVPRTQGTVVPMRGGGGETQVTVNVVNATGAQVKTRESRSPGRRDIEIAIGDVVAGDIARGGRIAQTLAATHAVRRRAGKQ